MLSSSCVEAAKRDDDFRNGSSGRLRCRAQIQARRDAVQRR
jgi:hypothetical protein